MADVFGFGFALVLVLVLVPVLVAVVRQVLGPQVSGQLLVRAPTPLLVAGGAPASVLCYRTTLRH